MPAQRTHDRDPSDNTPLAVVLVATALILVFAEATYAPPNVVPAAVADQFSGMRALQLLDFLVGDNIPHPAGSQQNSVVRGRIAAKLAEWGYVTIEQHAQAERYDGQFVPLVNLMVRIEGTGDGPPLMLACHYDSNPTSPGASDDGAAVAMILEISRMMTLLPPPKNDVILLITDGEEFGLLGARQFVGQHPWADDVAVVLNFEARGTSGPSMMFETSEQNYDLVRTLAQCAPHPRTSSLFYEVYKHLPNDTDFTVFKQHGMSGMNFAFVGNVANYHTPHDTISNLDPRSLQHHGENAWALVQALIDADLGQLSLNGDAVYFDVFGKFIVMWSARFTWPLVWLAVAMTFVGIARLWIAAPPLAASPVAWTFAASFCGVACVVYALLAGLALSPILETPWPRHPVAIQLAAVSAAMLVIVGIAQGVPRQCDSAVTGSCWMGFVILTIAVAWWLPGGSYFFIVPLLLGGPVAIMLAHWDRQRLAAAGWTVLLFLMCLPGERLFYDALGFARPEFPAIRLAIFGAAIFPQVNSASKSIQVALAVASAVLFAVCLTYAAE